MQWDDTLTYKINNNIMAITKTQRNWLIVAGLGLITTVVVYITRQYNALINAGKKIVGAKVHSMTLTKVNVTVFVEIENKGDLSVDITGQDYNVYVNDTYVSNIKAKEEIHINSNGKSVLPLNIEFNPSQVLLTSLTNLTSIMSDKSKVMVSVRGGLSLKSGALNVKNYSFELNMSLAEIIKAANETT